ncbi:MAG: hypothetical protein KatS3mg027_0407 [Bacteroidia bacterium]|nr:MAG: hypothetical protein KatS3mg027_0407 [Bacteroidia bacterium]
MLYSMTGYGKVLASNNQMNLNIEIKSLNSKGVDISLKCPIWLKALELDIRNYLQEKLIRGKIDVYFTIEWKDEIILNQINTHSLKKHYEQFKKVLDELNLDAENPYIIATIFREALNLQEKQMDIDDILLNEENKKLIFDTLETCCNKLIDFRKIEGNKLERDILDQIKLIENLKNEIAAKEPIRKQKVRNKILTTLKENFDESKIDRERFEQEMIYYIEKLDINEELVRLQSHIDYFRTICNNGIGMGRKLSFLTQEIGREINTIGSKANDEGIQKLVVEMKDALEKIKEQMNNIL